MTSVHVRAEAALDIAQAAEWYESQRTNLGVEFVLEVDAAIERATEGPQHYRPVHHEVRRVLVRRFPYNVFFIWRDDQIDIFAVLHQHRAAGAWQRRLD